ncbi:MAG: PQQ-binding-like beta-propeller repeat protein [Verrucomicrobiae bacterium]|nr:PQQ-binding-like beta-propeller repeat protein [Verrucomicrobiae bacterium]
MKMASIEWGLPAGVAVLGTVFLVLVFTHGRMPDLLERTPSMDRPASGAETGAGVDLSGVLTPGNGNAMPVEGGWPGFRGGRGGVSGEGTVLARSWGENGPPVLWSKSMGEGYAGAAVWKGRVYVMDYDQPAQRDVLRCLSLADGQEIWSRSYPNKVKRNHGMSRTVPAVNDEWVVALGPKCHVTCSHAVTGAHGWGLDLVRQFKTKTPPWYAGQCPLIDGGNVILAPGGGDVLMMAVELAAGREIWRTPNPRGWQMTHSSVAVVEYEGEKMYVYCASDGVAGVSAADGRILWDTTEWKVSIATVPSPVPCGEGRIFFSGGYDSGSLMMQLSRKEGKYEAAPLYRLDAAVFGATMQTPIFFGGCLYGVAPDGRMVCLGLDGRRKWDSGTSRFGSGPFLIADGLILALNDTGILSAMEARADAFKLVAQKRILNGHDAWGPLAISGGLLLARDLTTLVCVDLREK